MSSNLTMPSVCIMIPTYNQANYISLAIKSALEQNYPNLMVIVSDDCSTDNTSDIVQEYLSDKRLKYFRNQENIGRVANYRRCLYDLADADWVVNLDGDDYYTNTAFIATAIESIIKKGNENILFYQALHIKASNLESCKPVIWIFDKDEIVYSAKQFFLDWRAGRYFSHLGLLYNRKKAMESGFYEKDIISADIVSTYKMCINNCNNKVILAKFIAGIWVQHGQNTSGTLKFVTHWKNYISYFNLFLKGTKKNISGFSLLNWIIFRTLTYWKSYFARLFGF